MMRGGLPLAGLSRAAPKEDSSPQTFYLASASVRRYSYSNNSG